MTGTRAEYGLLHWLMREIASDPDLEMQTVVTGMHLSPEFGLTYRAIEADGFRIDEKIEILLSSDTPVGIGKSMGLAVLGFADALQRLKPDLVVMLGDRFEILAAAQAAMVARIPIAHLHGGEATEGLIDEAIRHSVTKMSHLHFTAAEPYRRRVIQLGENPDHVYNFGAVALDNVARLELLDRRAFEEAVGLKLKPTNFLVTYHPVTLSGDNPVKPMGELLGALDEFQDAGIIFTLPNADTDGRVLIRMIQNYAVRFPGRVVAHASLGQLRYLSAISHMDMVIGNSSSGLIEVPALCKPTVNLGDRQRGRLKAGSVIDCAENRPDIVRAMRLALSAPFRENCSRCVSPYGVPGASVKIKAVLKAADLTGILMKKFHDVGSCA